MVCLTGLTTGGPHKKNHLELQLIQSKSDIENPKITVESERVNK